jgi:hypothetical protein
MPKPRQVTGRQKSRLGYEMENASYAATATLSLDDDDYYREPIKRIVRPDNQVFLF